MASPKQVMMEQQQQPQLQIPLLKNSGVISYSGNNPMGDDKAEEMTRTALSTFRAKEEEIERRRKEALEGFVDPAGKEAAMVRKKIDVVTRELKSLGQTCQRKEKEYKETLDAFNGKSKEKAQLITKLMELVSESERMRMKKLEELSKNCLSLYSVSGFLRSGLGFHLLYYVCKESYDWVFLLQYSDANAIHVYRL
nr:structural maintenance of chromosomes protein 1A [Ipomoea batatas]GMD73875.1 structural maintenance of chromosomes protein 1A [Ipomoea batatas]